MTTTSTPPPNDHPPAPSPPLLHLHTYFRSSCSARLRIALHLKRLPFTTTPVHLLRAEQRDPRYLAVNPSGTVPTLIHTTATSATTTITQSTAALEYLDEAFPASAAPPLYPRGASREAVERRAHVRTLVAIVACDTQPLTNSAPVGAVKRQGLDGAAWAREWTERGLGAFEEYLRRTMDEGGVWCVGDAVTAADVCLVPAVWAAQRWGCDLEKWPRIMRVFRHMESLEAVKAAHWRNQEDTPEEFRET